MRLKDIDSKQLLPEFARDVDWIQDAFDEIVKGVYNKAKSIDAPLTMEAIEALTDSELQALYEQYGIAIYYPDLDRSIRNQMFYEMCRMYRYLGTPKAIEILVKYIFNTVQLNSIVHDNLAFNEYGELVDESLLDVFDLEVAPFYEALPADGADRILDNIIHFSRNTQQIRDIFYSLPDNNIDLGVAMGIPCDDVGAVIFVENNALCEPI